MLRTEVKEKRIQETIFLLIFLGDFISISNSSLSLRTVKKTNSFELPIFTPKIIEIEGRKLFVESTNLYKNKIGNLF